MNTFKNYIGPKPVVMALLCALMLCASPLTAHASSLTDVTVPSSGSTDQNVTANFTISNDTLIDLGYGAVASIPLSIQLTYDSANKNFIGGKTVYCSGIVAEGKKVTVNVDTANTAYGKITDPSANEYNVSGASGFSVTVSKTDWSAAEMASNYATSHGGNASDMITGYLTVKIPGRGFVPKVTGSFQSIIPLVIKQEDAS